MVQTSRLFAAVAPAPVKDRVAGFPPESPDILRTTPETARRLGVSRWTVKRLADRGFLEPVSVLSATRYRESDIERLIRFGTRHLPRSEAA
jgi:Helix-turn-helix domain